MRQPILIHFSHEATRDDIKQLKAFLRIMKAMTLDLSNDNEFRQIMSIAVKRFDFKASSIAEQFGVYRSTIKRWIDGTSLPPNIKHRKAIVDWLAEQIEIKISSTSNELLEIQKSIRAAPNAVTR